MMRKIFIGITLILMSCKFMPYSGSDIHNEMASLPEDEAPHVKNSLEWWYFTGQLNDVNSDRIYGVEYVVFHFNPKNNRDYLMTNFAVTDPEKGTFLYDHKIVRSDSLLRPDLPLDLTVRDKKITHVLQGQMGKYHIKANMRKEDIAMDLVTEPLKPVLFHNKTGYETYGSYAKAGYYSFPRLLAKGSLQINDESIAVAGELWYDRQWNCVGVWSKEVAWDWISVQLDEPRSELMVYRLHHFGDDKVLFGGSYYSEDNEVITLDPEDIRLEELEYWQGKKAVYPVKWRVTVQRLDLQLIIEAKLHDQELAISFSPFHKLYYWEGMCSVKGQMGVKSVTGKSYIELTNRDAFNK